MRILEGTLNGKKKSRPVVSQEIVDDSKQSGGLFGLARRGRKWRTAYTINLNRRRVLEQESKNLGPSSYETDAEDVAMLKLANTTLEKYLVHYNIPFTPVGGNRIRRQEILHNQDKMGGRYNQMTGTIHISPELRGFQHFVTLLHEIIHASGVNKFINMGDTYTVYRTGYEISQLAKKGERRMSGFNEGVIEMIVRDVVETMRDDVEHELGTMSALSEETTQYKISYARTGYELHSSLITDFETDLVQILHQQTFGDDSNATPKEFADEREKIVRGYFCGDMMHLRNIEKVFGPGSLQIVAALKWNDGYGTERGSLFQRFMSASASDWAEHLTIADAFITDTEDFARYVRANTYILESILSSVKEPVPESRSHHFERRIGIAQGMCVKIVTRLKTADSILARNVIDEYAKVITEAEEKREAYKVAFNLPADDVPVITTLERRHLTIKKS